MRREADELVSLRRLGDVLVRRRITSGRTQEQVAHDAGVSVAYLRRVERGTGNPSYLKLLAIVTALGDDVARIVTEAR